MSGRTRTTTAVVLGAVLVVAAGPSCGQPPPGGDDEARSAAGAARQPASEEQRRRAREGLQGRVEALERAALPESTEGRQGEVPEAVLEALVADLAQRLAIQDGSIRVVEATSVVFDSGALGCPEPGQVVTQAPVAGYRVVLARDDESYDYRATERGYFKLCAGPPR